MDQKPEKKFITEETGEQNEWYKEAKDVTMDTLMPFLKKLTEDYSHDLNTICHAMIAGALGAMAAMNRTPEGGIGNAQTQKMLGLFLRHWAGIEGPAKVFSWNGLLLPKNEPFFRTIPKYAAEDLKQKAKTFADELRGKEDTDPNILEHLEKISQGEFPWGYRVEE